MIVEGGRGKAGRAEGPGAGSPRSDATRAGEQFSETRAGAEPQELEGVPAERGGAGQRGRRCWLPSDLAGEASLPKS